MKDTTSGKSVKPRPAPGPVLMPTWKWELFNVGTPGGSLAINGKAYDVDPIHNASGVLVGWRLMYPRELGQDDVVYDIDSTGPEHLWTCDCADATYRQRECKHLKALKAALPKLAELQAQPALDDDDLDFSDLDDELKTEMEQLERGSDLAELLAWAEQTLSCAPVPCACTDTSDTGCLRCRVQRIVWTRQWQQELAKPE